METGLRTGAGTCTGTCDLGHLKKVLAVEEPEVVFHLAAQPLVLRSYLEPIDTFEVNIMGTANVLEAVRTCPSVKACVCITSDKCYENQEIDYAYRENDRMGGSDPYSASKGAELVISSYAVFQGPPDNRLHLRERHRWRIKWKEQSGHRGVPGGGKPLVLRIPIPFGWQVRP